MSRAPFVMAKAETGLQRSAEIDDTTIGWRFVNPLMRGAIWRRFHARDGENVAEEFQVSAPAQDAFASGRSCARGAAKEAGLLAEEIVPVDVPAGRAAPIVVDRDEHPRPTRRSTASPS